MGCLSSHEGLSLSAQPSDVTLNTVPDKVLGVYGFAWVSLVLLLMRTFYREIPSVRQDCVFSTAGGQ